MLQPGQEVKKNSTEKPVEKKKIKRCLANVWQLKTEKTCKALSTGHLQVLQVLGAGLEPARAFLPIGF